MIPKLYLLLHASVAFIPLWAQNPGYTGIMAKADKLVLELTSPEYFDQLKRDAVPFDARLASIDSACLMANTYTVIYFLNDPQAFNNMHFIYENGGLGPAGISIDFNDKLEVMEPRGSSLEAQAASQLRAFKRYRSSTFISKEKAAKISEQHFTEKFREPHGNYLFIYDSRSDSFMWRFEKFKGFRKLVVEEVDINAETGDFIGKKSKSLGRNFGQALFSYREI